MSVLASQLHKKKCSQESSFSVVSVYVSVCVCVRERETEADTERWREAFISPEEGYFHV